MSRRDKARKASYGVSYLRDVCSQASSSVAETKSDTDFLAVRRLLNFRKALVKVQVKSTGTKKLAARSARWTDCEQKQSARTRVVTCGYPRVFVPEEVA